MVMKERISNVPKINGQSTDNSSPLSASDLARLEGMTREELLALAKRMACQCGLVAAMTKDETAQAMKDVLAETALRSIVPGTGMKADIQSRMQAIDKWLDREEGKPAQTVMDVRQDNSNIIERAKWLLANGLATAKLLEMCKAVGIETTQYDVKLVNNDAL